MRRFGFRSIPKTRVLCSQVAEGFSVRLSLRRRRGCEAVRCVTRFCLEVENETAPSLFCARGKRQKKPTTRPIKNNTHLQHGLTISDGLCVCFLFPSLPFITLPHAECLLVSVGSIHFCPCTARGSPEQPHGVPLFPVPCSLNRIALHLSFTLLRITYILTGESTPS